MNELQIMLNELNKSVNTDRTKMIAFGSEHRILKLNHEEIQKLENIISVGQLISSNKVLGSVALDRLESEPV